MKKFFNWPIVLYLPFPPSINSYYVHTSRGVRVGNKGVQYKEQVYSNCTEQGIAELFLGNRLAISVILHPPDLRKRDMDNFSKGLFDSLTNSNIWNDDSQVDQSHVYRGKKVEGGKAVVIICEAGPVMPNGMEQIIIDEMI